MNDGTEHTLTRDVDRTSDRLTQDMTQLTLQLTLYLTSLKLGEAERVRIDQIRLVPSGQSWKRLDHISFTALGHDNFHYSALGLACFPSGVCPQYQASTLDVIFGSGGHSWNFDRAPIATIIHVSPPGTNLLPSEHHRGNSLTYNLRDKSDRPISPYFRHWSKCWNEGQL